MTPENQLEAVRKIVTKCQEAKFWGTITLQMSDGKLVEMRTSQSLKPERIQYNEEFVVCLKPGEEK